jgi:hypothetical protein
MPVTMSPKGIPSHDGHNSARKHRIGALKFRDQHLMEGALLQHTLLGYTFTQSVKLSFFIYKKKREVASGAFPLLWHVTGFCDIDD